MGSYKGAPNPRGVLPPTRVLELSQGWSAAAVCGRLLAELGADVVKVEPPEGDSVRRTGPTSPTGEAYAASLLLAGKRSLAPGPSAASTELLLRLGRGSDVVLMDPWWRQNLEPLAEEVPWREANPGLVMCYLSPFGQEGPFGSWKGTELVVQAMAGIMSVTGFSDGSPLRVGVPLASTLWPSWAAPPCWLPCTDDVSRARVSTLTWPSTTP